MASTGSRTEAAGRRMRRRRLREAATLAQRVEHYRMDEEGEFDVEEEYAQNLCTMQ
jgi:hypothetical protein